MSEPSGNQATGIETVRCLTWAEFVDRCAGDLARGGMYIPTAEPHTVWDVIGVRLSLPAGHEVELQGRIVHVVEHAQAVDKQMQPGIGIEFIDLDGPRAAALAQLLEYARTEGSLATPRYTFAQWLSTTAVSQAPSELMASLPPGPPTPGERARAERESRDSQQRRRTDPPEPRRAKRSETARSSVRMREPPKPSSRQTNPGTSRSPAARSLRPPSTSRSTASRAPEAPRASKAPEAPRTSTAPEAPRTSEAPAARDSMAPPTPKTEDMHSTREADQLKLGMTHLAHRRYREATGVFNDMISHDPADKDARLWLHMSEAREAAAAKRNDAAVAHYRKLLVVDPKNREATDKIKALQKSGGAFGRFFSKK